MSQNHHRDSFLHEGLITALAVGGFLIILGLVFALTPGITDKTTVFFNDLTTVTRQLGSSTINLPAPAHPAEHLDFYTALMNFFLGVGVLEIVILALRLAVHSRIRRIGETAGNLVFWLGAAAVANVYLLAGTLNGWFQFWSVLIVVFGVSLVARFFVQLAGRHSGPDQRI
jgi:hypothetical protein